MMDWAISLPLQAYPGHTEGFCVSGRQRYAHSQDCHSLASFDSPCVASRSDSLMSSVPVSLPPAPRRVRTSIGYAAQLWLGRIFVLPHTLIGIGALGYWVFLLLWGLFGMDVPGAVTGTDTHQTSKGRTVYTLKYEFPAAGGQTRSASSSVSKAMYERIQAADSSRPPVTVRYLNIGGFDHHELRKHQSGVWASFGFLTIWVLFWNSIMSVFIYGFWIRPIRVRRLYKYGDVTGGKIVGKRTRTGKTTTYYVSYEFRHPITGEMVSAETQASNRADWERASDGQPVTVLYAFNKPKRSTVYEYGGYRVEGVRGGLDPKSPAAG